jgi:hypothetical protein
MASHPVSWISILLLSSHLFLGHPSCLLPSFNNEHFSILSNTIMCLLLRTATCFSLNWPSLGYQCSVLKQGQKVIYMEFTVYNFTVWDHTSVQFMTIQ